MIRRKLKSVEWKGATSFVEGHTMAKFGKEWLPKEIYYAQSDKLIGGKVTPYITHKGKMFLLKEMK